MTTHGHRLLADLIHGTTITKVRHEAEIPTFLVRAAREQLYALLSGDRISTRELACR